MGTLDRAAARGRGLVLWLAFGTAIADAGMLHWSAIIAAASFALIAIIGICPIYTILGMKTCKTP